MRIYASIAVAVVSLALAGSAAASISKHMDADSTVVSSVYLGTSSVPGACTMTLIAGHVANFSCPGAARHADAGSCTLTVASRPLWTYSCPDGKTGASRGFIPKSCKSIDESGYRWTFSCPRSAFGGSSTTGKAASTGHIGTAVASLPCLKAMIDGYITSDRCSV